MKRHNDLSSIGANGDVLLYDLHQPNITNSLNPINLNLSGTQWYIARGALGPFNGHWFFFLQLGTTMTKYHPSVSPSWYVKRFVPSDMLSWVWPLHIINSPKSRRLIQISRIQRAKSSKSQAKDCSKGLILRLWSVVGSHIPLGRYVGESTKIPTNTIFAQVMQYVAVCYSVLQCAEKNVKHSAVSFVWYCSVYCSVLQCTAVC